MVSVLLGGLREKMSSIDSFFYGFSICLFNF